MGEETATSERQDVGDLELFTRPMVSVQVVAWLMIAVGISSIFDIVLDLVISSKIDLDLGFLGIFIGRGLLRYSESWRKTGVFFTVAIPVFFVTALVFAALATSSRGNGTWDIQPSPRAAAVFGFLFLLYLIWQYRVLTKPAYARMCRLVSIERNADVLDFLQSRPRSFSLLTLMLIMMSVAIVITSIVTAERSYSGERTSIRTSTTPGKAVTAQYRRARHAFWPKLQHLDYVIFAHFDAPQQIAPIQTGGQRRNGRDFSIGGTQYRLPRGIQLCEVNEETMSYRDADVTVAELELFLRTSPATAWKIDELIAFVAAQRESE